MRFQLNEHFNKTSTRKLHKMSRGGNFFNSLNASQFGEVKFLNKHKSIFRQADIWASWSS